MTSEMKSLIEKLFKCNIPISVISGICKVCEAKIRSFVKTIRIKDAKKNSLKELRIELFEIYVGLLFDQQGFEASFLCSAEQAERAKKALYKFLHLELLEASFEGVVKAVKSFREPLFDPEIPLEYQNLIKEIFFSQNKTFKKKDFWVELLEVMYKTNTYPEELNQKGFDPFVQKFLATERANVAHFFSKVFLLRLKNVINSFNQNERMALEIKFSLPALHSEETLNWQKTATNARIHQVANRAQKRLFFSRRIQFPEWNECIEQLFALEKRMEMREQVLIKKLQELIPELDYKKLEFLARPIASFNELDNRTKNCLRSCDLNFFFKVFSKSKKELLEIRHFHKRSLVKLEELGKKNGFDFETKFSPAVFVYLQQKIDEK